MRGSAQFSLFDRKPKPAESAAEGEARLLAGVNAGGAKCERIVLTENRHVMASARGRTLRLSRLFLAAPAEVLAAVGRALSARGAARRAEARAVVRAYLAALSENVPSGSRRATAPYRPRAVDRPHLRRLAEEFHRVNAAFFGGRLPVVTIRLCGRMRRRNGHFRSDPLEIAISRRLCELGAEAEAERTLRHEMIHLWQWVEGRKPGHQADFRRWARRLEITPRATRPVLWNDAA